jgi:hypothetical protein
MWKEQLVAYFNVTKMRTMKIFGIAEVPVYMPNGRLPSRNEKQRFCLGGYPEYKCPFINTYTLETK